MYWTRNSINNILSYCGLGTIHILRNHIFRIFEPPPPLRKHVLSTKNNQKLAFSDPPSPYKWLRNIWLVPYTIWQNIVHWITSSSVHENSKLRTQIVFCFDIHNMFNDFMQLFRKVTSEKKPTVKICRKKECFSRKKFTPLWYVLHNILLVCIDEESRGYTKTNVEWVGT